MNIANYLQAFDRLSLRERALILLTVLVALLLPALVYLIEPLINEQQARARSAAQLQAANRSKHQDIETLRQLRNRDPNPTLQAEIEQLQGQLAAVEADIRDQAKVLLSPPQMLSQLEAILAAQPTLTLVSLEKTEGQPLRAPLNEFEPPAAQAALYRHALELVVEGERRALQRYLKQLQQLSAGLYLDAVDYRLQTVDSARLQVRLHSLSMQPGWLGLE